MARAVLTPAVRVMIDSRFVKGNMAMGKGLAMMTRRKLLQAAIAAGIWHLLGGVGRAGQALSMKDIENMQKNWRSLLAKDFKA
ncbi:MAG TPA: hypothetical protein VF089_19405, partial [Candidatus Binatia bacterium]